MNLFKLNKTAIILFVCIVICNISIRSQTPNRTVNFSQTVGGAANFTSISEALDGITTPAVVWVAVGEYTEDEIIVPVGVSVIGGFPKNAQTADERIYPGNASIANQSILSGVYSHRVATVYGTLEGFVITKGYVYDEAPNSLAAAGGGVLIDGGKVINCIIHNNVASEVPPTPDVIPGTFVASIGDIYCTDGTILQPIYSVNQGKIVATLDGGIPEDKTVMGIIFHVDPAPTNAKFHVMGKVNSTNKKMWFNPKIDISNLPNTATQTDAIRDFNGRSNTDSIMAHIPKWLAANGNPWYNTDYAALWAVNYNIPSGTMGAWYLPASGELYKIWEAYPQIEACARDILGWSTEAAPMFIKGSYSSSTEHNSNNFWGLDTNSYPWGGWGLKDTDKTESCILIPVTIIDLD